MKAIENFTKAVRGSDIFNKRKMSHLQAQLDTTAAEMERLQEMVIKPDYSVYKREVGVQPMNLPVRVQDIYALYKHVAVLRTVVLNIKNEIFRQPPVWRAKFVVKCNNCEREYMKEVSECENCGSTSLRKPDIKQVDKLEKYINQANKNEQTLKSVFKQCEEDLNVIDDMYLIAVKEYIADDDGIQYERIKEFVRGDPAFMRIVSNDKGEIGNRWWVCPLHRHPDSEAELDIQENKLGRVYEEPGKCPVCGRKLYEVHYVSVEGGDPGMSPANYYIRGEVIHASKYSPSLLYGTSPILSVWKEASTLMNMANYINSYYKYQRNPKGALFMNSMNPESMYKKWDEVQERLRQDPHYIPMLVGQGDSNGKGQIQFVKFMDSLQEMGYGESKDELRQRVSSIYGVSNILMNDGGTSGGLNNEGLQIKVTDRSVEVGQGVWNEEVFPKICAMLGIVDWELWLMPNEETDKMKKVQLETSKAQHAQIMQSMGFKVELDAEGGFVFSGEAIDMGAQQEQAMAAEEEAAAESGYDEGMVAPGEEPEDLGLIDADDEAEGGQYRDLFFANPEDKRDPTNKGSGSPVEISGEIKKVLPWRKGVANGYRKVEIVRRDGQKQGIWVKDMSPDELGEKRGGGTKPEIMDTHHAAGVEHNKLDDQRRPYDTFKREGYSTRFEHEDNVVAEKPPSPEKQKSLDIFTERNHDVTITLVGRDNDQQQQLLQGHPAGYNPETKDLVIDANLSIKEFNQVLETYNKKIQETDNGESRKRKA